jgi:dTDP-4-amino-4,6-dideoxygalactose transaminase
MDFIPFNRPTCTGHEETYILNVIKNKKYAGDYEFTKLCNRWFRSHLNCLQALLVTSCTHALDMSAILADIVPGDEVIMPSYTFTSTANAFVLRGAKIVFIDIRPDTMNINEKLIEAAVTSRTKVICVMHYAGVPCEMDAIIEIAKKKNLLIVEDAAQAILSTYKGRWCGTMGDFGCFSFHETKNIQCGEGGMLIINQARFMERAEILREKGTNRSKFFRGEIDKYSWVDMGSSYLPSELNAAFLFAQLESIHEVLHDRITSWNLYYRLLKNLQDKGCIELPCVPGYCEHNGHMFYIKTRDCNERDTLIKYLKDKNISSVFHYVPLHSSQAGKKFGTFIGEDKYTTRESERLLRLPMFYMLTHTEVEYIAGNIHDFFKSFVN